MELDMVVARSIFGREELLELPDGEDGSKTPPPPPLAALLSPLELVGVRAGTAIGLMKGRECCRDIRGEGPALEGCEGEAVSLTSSAAAAAEVAAATKAGSAPSAIAAEGRATIEVRAVSALVTTLPKLSIDHGASGDA